MVENEAGSRVARGSLRCYTFECERGRKRPLEGLISERIGAVTCRGRTGLSGCGSGGRFRAVIHARCLLAVFRRDHFWRGRHFFAERAIQLLKILLVQRAQRIFDVQLVDQVTVTRIRQLLFSVKQRGGRV